jgi:hypothetical protein
MSRRASPEHGKPDPGLKIEFQETPNPHALKCVVEPWPAGFAFEHPTRSYRSAAEAAGDPLASKLLAIPGVGNVLVREGWFTIGREAGAAWKTIRPAVEQVVRAGA